MGAGAFAVSKPPFFWCDPKDFAGGHCWQPVVSKVEGHLPTVVNNKIRFSLSTRLLVTHDVLKKRRESLNGETSAVIPLSRS